MGLITRDQKHANGLKQMPIFIPPRRDVGGGIASLPRVLPAVIDVEAFQASLQWMDTVESSPSFFFAALCSFAVLCGTTMTALRSARKLHRTDLPIGRQGCAGVWLIVRNSGYLDEISINLECYASQFFA